MKRMKLQQQWQISALLILPSLICLPFSWALLDTALSIFGVFSPDRGQSCSSTRSNISLPCSGTRSNVSLPCSRTRSNVSLLCSRIRSNVSLLCSWIRSNHSNNVSLPCSATSLSRFNQKQRSFPNRLVQKQRTAPEYSDCWGVFYFCLSISITFAKFLPLIWPCLRKENPLRSFCHSVTAAMTNT